MNYAEKSMSLAHYDAGRIALLTDYPAMIAHLADAHRRPAIAPVRLGARGDLGLEMLVMPVMSARYAGAKILAIQPGNSTRGIPIINGLFALLGGTDGVPLATMDASELTACRTAAVSALASQYLSRADASRLLVIGSGHLAPYLAEAHSAARPISHVDVWARDMDKAADCMRRIAQRLPGCEITLVVNVDEAVASADIISCATRSTQPIVKGKLLQPGTHIDAVGGYRPNMREVDDTTVRRARVFVDHREAGLAEAGDLIGPINSGVFSPADIQGDLAAIVAGTGRRSSEEITLFKSVGSAVADLAIAELLWESRLG